MAKNEGRPGVMFYFRMRESLQFLTNEEKGTLFEAILDYAQHGKNPKFEDRALTVAWGFIKAGIDDDAERYEDIKDSRSYAAYCRECKKDGREPMTREDFLQRKQGSV